MKIIRSFLVFSLTGTASFFLIYAACKFLDESQNALALALGILMGLIFTVIDISQTEK